MTKRTFILAKSPVGATEKYSSTAYSSSAPPAISGSYESRDLNATNYTENLYYF
jgi:hypothetical protein